MKKRKATHKLNVFNKPNSTHPPATIILLCDSVLSKIREWNQTISNMALTVFLFGTPGLKLQTQVLIEASTFAQLCDNGQAT